MRALAPEETRVLKPEERDVPTGAAALAKGLYLLDVIGEQATPPRFKDLQAATGLSKGTLARMLNTLVLFRFVRHEDSDSTYRLGHRLFELAHRVWEAFDLRGAAFAVLDRLADELRETVALCSIENDEVLYIDQRSRGGPFEFRIEIGRRAPLHCTAGGKTLLAFLSPHEQRALLDRLRLGDSPSARSRTRMRLLPISPSPRRAAMPSPSASTSTASPPPRRRSSTIPAAPSRRSAPSGRRRACRAIACTSPAAT